MHSVDAKGAHRFELVLRPDEVKDDRPKVHKNRPLTFGATPPGPVLDQDAK